LLEVLPNVICRIGGSGDATGCGHQFMQAAMRSESAPMKARQMDVQVKGKSGLL
jgi:hypothetical protein